MSVKTANENILNRVARVFVSSTFRDMEPERDYLMTKIFPRVRQYCRAKDVEFVPLDLRWGITTEESETGHVTEVCLKEIEKSRPFFIGMLGERYGWQPGAEELERNPNLALDFSFLQDDFGEQNLSITEVEMQFGVLRWQGEPIDAAFWLRSREMPTPEEFCEKPGSPAATKLQRLKEEIRTQKTYFVAEYTSLKDLGEQIYNEFIMWIDKQFPGAGVTWLQKQNIEQSSFERSRTRLYVPRPSDYTALDAFLASDAQTLTVTGISGTGKSALLANWIDDYRKRFKNVYFLSHYVSASSGSDSPAEILHRLTEILDLKSTEQESTENRLKDLLKDLSKNAKTLEDRTKECAQAVGVYCSRHPDQKLVIVLDGMNQLNPADDAKNLTWFPLLPDCVKVLFSTIDSDQTMQTFKRLGYKQFTVEPLSEEQRNKIIVEFLSDRGRKLTLEQTARIAANPESRSPLILRTLLDELCVFGVHEKLNERIDWYLSAKDPEDFFNRVLERLENDYGLKETCILLTSLAVSRFGLSETELIRILIQFTGFTPRTVSTLLCALDSHIVNRSGLYDFAHDIIRSAIKTRYESHLTQASERLVKYFLSDANESFSRQCQEVPWQYQTLQRWDDLYQFLLNFAVMDDLYNNTLNCDFCLYWSELLQLKYSPEAYFARDVSGESKPDQADNWFKLAHFVSLFHHSKFIERGYTEALAIYRELATQNPEEYRPYLADTLNNLGTLYADNGRLDLAEAGYNEALGIRRELATQNPEEYLSDVATSLSNLGVLYYLNGRLDLAEAEYNEALAIRRKLAAQNPEKYRPDLADTLNNQGNLHKENGRLDLAEAEYNEALGIRRELAAQNPEEYRPDLASLLNNLASLHADKGRPDKAKKEYNEALAIYRELASKFLEAYLPYAATTLYNLGNLHANNGRPDKAEEVYNKALTIRSELAVQNPEKYLPDVADMLNNLGIQHQSNGRPDLAKKEYKKALTIYRELAAHNPEKYRPNVANTLNNQGVLHDDNGRPDLAEAEYNKALAIRRELAAKSPEKFRPDLADTLNNLGDLHNDNGSPDLAENEYKEALVIRRELAAKFPKKYLPDLAMTIGKLGVVYANTNRKELALTSLEEALGIFQKLAEKNPNAFQSDYQEYLQLLELIQNM